MTASYVITPAAWGDLQGIWKYSADNWNSRQADRYILDLAAAVESVAAGNRTGRSCDEIRPGYFKITAGSHVIFYRFAGARVDVIRVLHQRMDFNRHS